MNVYKLSEKFENVRSAVIRHSLIQISDNCKITIEECRNVLMFDENTVKLRLSYGTVTITGLDLKMRNFSDRGVIITGKLHSLGFDED